MSACKHILIIATLLIAQPALIACSEEKPAPKVIKKVKAMKLGAVESIDRRAFPGKAKAVSEASLSFRVSGQMASRPVNVGDKVKAGDLLASLDDVDFKNAVKVAEGLLGEAEAANIDAAKNYKRALDIQKSDPGVISAQMIDKAKANDAITAAARKSAAANLKLAKDRLSYTKILAPFDGEIVAAYVESFETIIAKQRILRIMNPDSMEFVFDVPESLIGYANMVESASVTFDVNTKVSIPATVKEVGREASQSTRTYPVTLLIDNAEEFSVLPGMAGKAFIKAKIPDSDSGLIIPASAIFSTDEITNSFVWVIIDDKVSKRKVTISAPSDFGIKISEGINSGDWIVVAGVHSLVEGQQVRVLDVAAERD